jgi:hypothetical protein
MSEHHDVIENLITSGVLGAFKWAYESAVFRTLADHSEAAGHNATTLGVTRHALFTDRLDRVFSCGRYSVGDEFDATSNLDVLLAELSEVDAVSLPQLDPHLVERSDLHGSPGWVFNGRRFLIAACQFGQLETLPWARKSPTKQLAALQGNPDAIQDSLFVGSIDDEIFALLASGIGASKLDLETFIVAHTLDGISGQRELALGRAKLNFSGGRAWHWREDVLTSSIQDSSADVVNPDSVSDKDVVEDAPVRLRKANGQGADAGNGGN